MGTRSERPAGGLLSYRLQVRFDAQLFGPLRERARGSGQSLSATVRDLVCGALDSDRHRPGHNDESTTGLATLVAAEHAVLMVASVLPEGERRMRELGPQAAIAAEARLAMFREPGR